jgi:hypothetical protein
MSPMQLAKRDFVPCIPETFMTTGCDCHRRRYVKDQGNCAAVQHATHVTLTLVYEVSMCHTCSSYAEVTYRAAWER